MVEVIAVPSKLLIQKRGNAVLLYQQETSEIISCAMEVANEIGHGFLEKPYENALVVEFRRRGICYNQQMPYEIRYKGVQVGTYIPDLIVFGKVIVDTKTIDQITSHELGQMINYLRITGLRVGLIINFKKPRIEWKRVMV